MKPRPTTKGFNVRRRRTRSEIRDEYVKLLDVWVHVRAFEIERDRAFGDFDTESLLPSRELLLEQFDARKAPASQLVTAMRSTLNEMATGFAGAIVHNEDTAREFLAFYKDSSGRDFFVDMGDPMARLKSILKRGHILDDDEFYSVKTVVDDNLDLLTTEDLALASDMLGDYEFRS
ncbi:hypothetical protein [Marimonas arenosa]|uniref:Uncharacterized protein n=1 Tax=Marimonas arenosa TaxID=1795305 RepID=A0AAE3WGP8_9RHOB|nr:hypothetical protein [Marimonas arenosa]MDQ2092085.1 hypothetical protein [Marimonas arenosa]